MRFTPASLEKLDGRKLDHKTREAIRKRAVQRVLDGESPEAVIKALGFHRSAVYQWLKRYEKGGIEALSMKKIPGVRPKLTTVQKKMIFDIVTTKTPEQYQCATRLWTVSAVHQVIYDCFRVKLSEVSVARLLRELGFVAGKPVQRAWQKRAAKDNQWFRKEYPTIQKEARKAGATVYFVNETTVHSDYETTPTPVSDQKAMARSRLTMICAVSAKSSLRFVVTCGKATNDNFIDFLARMVESQARPAFLVMESNALHTSKRVIAFVAATEGKMRLFHAPACSLQLTPDALKEERFTPRGLGKRVLSVEDEMEPGIRALQ